MIEKLKKLYAKDEDQAAYIAYDEFESFKRPASTGMVDYLNEFERLYNKIKCHRMELPSGVLAYRLLKSANISEDRQQLARATLLELTYENMKKQLKAIFDTSSVGDGQTFKSSKKVTLPANIANKDVTITTDIVDCDLL